MDFQLSEEQSMIRDTAGQFAESELAPLAAKFDKGEEKATFMANLKELAELGFMGLNVKAEYGGTEAGVVAFSLAITEIAKACASTAVTTSVTNMVAEVIQAMGTEEQRQKYLPKITSGEYAAGGSA
jgi:alkylation response protein AidB-like acyl-CoA dehydrogenase